MGIPKRIPVSFVGLPHSDRRHVVQRLRDAGIDVQVFGKGWGRGRVTQGEMIRIFNESCVNLNLANASVSTSRAARALTIARNVAARLPLSVRGRRMTNAGLDALERRILSNQRATYPEQLKGRNFEVPGCGGFLLTPHVTELQDYYEPDREVGCYRGTTDLISKARAYVTDTALRESIAVAGRERTLRQHTYAHRFAEIFAQIGLQSTPPDAVLRGEVQPGRTEEII
jgi:spore maturation protein CgeB